MAFDGIFLHSNLAEIGQAIGCHIDKIYQPSRDELVFLLRKKGFVGRLLFCIRSGAARIQLTEKKYENPATPPMLCMLVRKHFSGAKLLEIKQMGFDRAVSLLFEATNEMGDRVRLTIVCELMGNCGNVIFVAADGRIIDAMRRSDLEGVERIIQSGAVYEPPKASGKLELTAESAQLADRILLNSQLPLNRAVLGTIEGISPLVSREIALLAGCEGLLAADCQRENLIAALDNVKGYLSAPAPTMLCASDGTPTDFSYMPITQYGSLYRGRSYNEISSLLDDFYAEREAAAFIKHAAGDIVRLTETLITRVNKRRAERIREREDCRDCEKMRIYGELIKANIHLIPAGAASATVQNFYDENLSEITIKLNPAITAAANAAKYFKNYKKSHTALQLLDGLIENDRDEIVYLESVRESIDRCRTAADIAEIREELRREGYIKSQQRRQQKAPQGSFAEYVSAEGFRIAVGKNNTQNDLLTTKTAAKNDMWFHVKGVAGSHVVVFCGGEPISDETVLYAARLAAQNSKAAASSNVAVDYTPVKYVKKPNGAKAGMVIYTTNKTVYVTPNETEGAE